MNRIWEARLDDKYDVYVVDGIPATAYVELDGEVLASKNVVLSYGAIFGPDMFDVEEWAQWAVSVVDNLPEAV